MEQEKILAVRENGFADVGEILAQRDLSTRNVDPAETVGALEKAADFVESELILRLHLPDVAGLATIVAPEGDAEGELEREVQSPYVRSRGPGGQLGIGG